MADEPEETTQLCTVTYSDLEDEAPRVDHLGQRFYHGQPVKMRLTQAQIDKLNGNPFFAVEVSDAELPLAEPEPPKPAAAPKGAWSKGTTAALPTPVKA